ncbi:MAG: pyridoxamine 5'-phosphate oxidase family protein [Dehalococcoidia bacterium]
MQLPPPVEAFIERQRTARLALTAEDGPHLLAIRFALLDGAVVTVAGDEGETPGLRALYLNPEAALLWDEYSEDWTRLGWVEARGRATVLDGGDEHARALSALRDRYPQYRSRPLTERLVIRVEPVTVRHWGLREDDLLDGVETRGLNLVRTEQRIAAPHVITEYRAGVSTGALALLVLSGDGLRRLAMESHDETAMPDEGGRMLRYRIEDLEDGIYAAESVGPADAVRTTYLEVTEAAVRRIFESERRATQELRRRAR